MKARSIASLGVPTLCMLIALGCTESNAPPAASRLVFTTWPATGTVGMTMPARVAALDQQGTVVTSFTGPVTLALAANPGNATLSGTLTVAAVAGVATFADLSVDKGEDGYTLRATSGTLTAATSGAFDIAEFVTQYALRWDLDCVDLEAGVVSDNTSSCFTGAGPSGANDVQLPCCAQGWPGVFHNSAVGQIAHLIGSRFARVHLTDTAGVGWSSQLLSEPFDTTRTVLIRTGAGNIYKLGNPGPAGSGTTRFDTARIN